MAQLLTDDDELLQDEDEQRKRAAQQTIGSPLAYGPMPQPRVPSSSDVPAVPPPDAGATSTPGASTIAGVAPYKPINPTEPPPSPNAERPQSQIFTDWMAKEAAEHPAGKPRYPFDSFKHGLQRVGDTIAQMTWPGQAAEIGGEFGTLGARAKAARLAGNAAEENTQIGYGQKEEEEKGRIAEQAAKAETEKTGAELVDVTLPDGTKQQVMRKNIASPTAAIITSGNRLAGVEDTNTTRKNIADTNAGAKEETAKIMVGGKEYGTKDVMVGDKPHVMMWNPNTHSYDRDLGEAPPKQAASSAYANTRTVHLLDPETGIPTVFQYNAATNSYDKLVGTSATGAYGHEMAQAGAVGRSGKDIISQLRDPANREILGNLGSYIAQGTLGTPLADEKAAFLSSQLKTFAALQPAMHGFRARSAQEAFEKIVGGLAQDPDATIAAIEGILRTSQAIRPTPQANTPKPGGIQRFGDWQTNQAKPVAGERVQ